MEILNRILIWLGGLLLIVVVILSYIGLSRADFEREHRQFVESYLIDISENWDIEDVIPRTTSGALEMIASSEGRKTMDKAALLGSFESLIEYDMEYYTFGITGGSSGVILTKVKFKNSVAIVRFVVIEMENGSQVHSFNVKAISNIPKENHKYEA